MARLNYMVLAIGQKGVGKSSQALKMAIATGKTIIVLDDVVNSVYVGFERIKREQLPNWKGARCIVEIDDFDECLKTLSQCQRNAFIICEDSSRYISSNISLTVKTFIVNHRKFNYDVAFMFHYLGEIPPYICKQYTHMLLFKTADNLNVTQNKWMAWHIIKPKAEAARKNKSNHHFETIGVNDK